MQRQGQVDAGPTCATDVERPLLFRVHVDEATALQKIGSQIAGAGQSGLFIHSKQKLQRPVFNVGAFHDGQSRGHADAIVGTECGSHGIKVTALFARFDRIVVEIVLHIGILFIHHVQMRLQNGNRR